MNHHLAIGATLLLALPAATALYASEARFLQRLAGSWTGGGAVRLTPDSAPVNVTCALEGQTTEVTAELSGTCTGLLFFTTDIGAELSVEDGAYVGTYVGSARGAAALEGNREGRAIDLSMRWPDHPVARMTLESPAEGRMAVTTVETHPETGEPIITSDLELQRE